MKSQPHGTSTSDVEILKVSQRGIRMRIAGTEYFMDFIHFPWFKSAKVDQILNVQLLHGTHLYWEELDVDLELNSIKNPADYPLISK